MRYCHLTKAMEVEMVADIIAIIASVTAGVLLGNIAADMYHQHRTIKFTERLIAEHKDCDCDCDCAGCDCYVGEGEDEDDEQ